MPAVPDGLNYGKCGACGRFRPYGYEPDGADRMLRALSPGSRIPATLKPQLETLWAERRSRRETQP